MAASNMPWAERAMRRRARVVNLSLRIRWPQAGGLRERRALHAGPFAMSPDAFTSFFALALGFAVAGMLTHGYQAALQRPASFRLLQAGPVPSAFAAVPFLMFAAPFIIMRTTLRNETQASRRDPVRRVRNRVRRLLEPDVRHLGDDGPCRPWEFSPRSVFKRSGPLALC